MSEFTRRACMLGLASGIAGCSQAGEAMARINVQDQVLTAFRDGLVRFARTQLLRIMWSAQYGYYLDGWGMHIDVDSFSPSANGRTEYDAFFCPGMFWRASPEHIQGVADTLVRVMNSISGITAFKDTR